MKLLKIFLIITILLMVTNSVSAKKEIAVFNSGNDYMQFPVELKLPFVGGLMDTAVTLTQYYDPEEYLKISEIIEDMTLGQIVKIFDKYLEENPEELHNAAAVSFFYAIYEIVYQE